MMKADESQILFGSIDEIDGWTIPLVISWEEAVALIQAYDPDNQFSPPAAESREIARVFLDALKKAMEG
jgi:hypothetical protein